MKNSKSSGCGDRLSKLPDSLIFHIFWFLPIIDVVGTTVLSKRWKDLWTTAPFLNLDDYSIDRVIDYPKGDSFRDFINRALMSWRGERILKFKMDFRCDLTRSLVSDIGVWLRLAKDKKIEELSLDLQYSNSSVDFDVDFECLYSCSSLKVLSLKGYPLEIAWNGNVNWDQLKSLAIHGKWLDQYSMSKVMCGSPKLEVFTLVHMDWESSLYIQSSSLKKLSIDKFLDVNALNTSRNTELTIQAPNLERLEISGLPYGKFQLNASSLTDVALGFCGQDQCECSDLDEFLGKTLKQILPAIQNVESVTLSEWCLKVLGAMNENCLLSPLSKVKSLQLNASISKHEQIAGLLQIFPKLKRLVIKDEEEVYAIDDKNEDNYLDDWEPLVFEANLPNSFLMQLRTVDVTRANGNEMIFSFIEILLKYASKLEKMVFHMPPSSPSHALFLTSRKLLNMPSSSPTARVIFRGY